jgi:predicted O-linked N-acetylglucosamine transferase (SPINDLY family)
VREDGVDVLVDLTLQTSHRLFVIAQKPAPVQVSFAAYPGTTGLATIDYRLTDPYLDPPGETDADYTERSLRLRSFWCYEPPEETPPVGPLPAERNG